jgi:hypothetical protein
MKNRHSSRAASFPPALAALSIRDRDVGVPNLTSFKIVTGNPAPYQQNIGYIATHAGAHSRRRESGRRSTCTVARQVIEELAHNQTTKCAQSDEPPTNSIPMVNIQRCSPSRECPLLHNRIYVTWGNSAGGAKYGQPAGRVLVPCSCVQVRFGVAVLHEHRVRGLGSPRLAATESIVPQGAPRSASDGAGARASRLPLHAGRDPPQTKRADPLAPCGPPCQTIKRVNSSQTF